MEIESNSSWLKILILLVMGVISLSIAYFIDQARGAAFVLIPYVVLRLVLEEVEINRKTKPILAYSVWLLFSAYSFVVIWKLMIDLSLH